MSIQIDLTGRNALVTGSTRGIGRAIAETLARCGACVAVVGRDLDRSQAVAAEIGSGAAGFAADVGDRAEREGFGAVAGVGDAIGQNLVRRSGRRRHVGSIAGDGDVEQLIDFQVDAVRSDRLRAAAVIEAGARGIADRRAGERSRGVGRGWHDACRDERDG